MKFFWGCLFIGLFAISALAGGKWDPFLNAYRTDDGQASDISAISNKVITLENNYVTTTNDMTNAVTRISAIEAPKYAVPAWDLAAATNITYRYDIAISWQSPTNAAPGNIVWGPVASAPLTLVKAIGITEAGTIQGVIVEGATNSHAVVSTNYAGLAFGTGGTVYSTWGDSAVAQWARIGFKATNAGACTTTNFSLTIHATYTE